MRKLFIVLFFCFHFIFSFSQNATVKGSIKDGKTNEPLEGAVVAILPSNGTVADVNGQYELKAEPGKVTLVISYLGMLPDTQTFTLKANETKVVNIALGNSANELQTVVIGESKVGIKIQKVTQSVDVIKPRMLQSNNITNMQQAMSKIPGVTILDGQMSVRGGSGYAYGSGSRVTLIIDEMPLMSADRGEIKWAFIPIENVEQIQLLKGAATVQYGASALNGVMNITTAYATDTPSTSFSYYYEGYGNPKNKSYQWWKRDGKVFNNPNAMGMTFLHKQKFGAVDFVFSGMMQGFQSHLNEEYDHFIRFNNKLRWQPKNLKRLTLELSTSVLYRKSGFQFYWKGADNPYLASSGVSIDEKYFYATIDPKIRYVDKGGNTHKFLNRIFRQKNLAGQTNFWVFRNEYQFRHDFGKLAKLVVGALNEHAMVSDGTLGNHKTDDASIYAFTDINWKWLTFNAGVRAGLHRLDTSLTPTQPVFSAGVNFEIRKYNYIRASFGQAFRLPSIAEQFVEYDLAGIKIIPNYGIKPESGFTAELGYKRSLKIGKWLGYVDAVLFWTEFKNMIEFTFDVGTKPGQPLFYFQSRNVAKARIFGWEVSAYGEGNIGPVNFTTLLGYTYFYGVDLNDTTSPDRNVGHFLKNAFKRFVLPTTDNDHVWDSLTDGMLRYRNPHSFKMDFDFIFYKKYHFGTAFQYYSYMTLVDKVFEGVIPDVGKIRRETRNQGDFVWDLRVGYDINRNVSFNFIVKNVLDRSYALRVAKPDKPRTFTAQMVVNFGGGKKGNMSNGNSRAIKNL